jgi:chromosome partitioning protein
MHGGGTAGQQPSKLASQGEILPVSQQSSVLEIMLASRLALRYGRPMIIAVANAKGGVGKSTVSVHLAAWLHALGHRVTLVDCDKQHSSAEWIAEAAPGVKRYCFDDPDQAFKQLPLLAAETDYIVADGPGSAEMSRLLLLRSDKAIVPAKASMLEARALDKATEHLRQSQGIRGGRPEAIVVLSMVGRHYRLTQDMKAAAETLGLRMAKTWLILRQVYADAPGQGTVVSNMGIRARDAAQEVDALFREILPEACRGRGRKPKRN